MISLLSVHIYNNYVYVYLVILSRAVCTQAVKGT